MTAALFLCDDVSGDVVVLTGPEGRHAATVRRVQVGEAVDLADGRGTRARCTVVGLGHDTRRAAASTSGSSSRAPTPWLVVAQGIAKGDRGELAVELATEVGVDEVLPWAAARCVVKWEGARGERALGALAVDGARGGQAVAAGPPPASSATRSASTRSRSRAAAATTLVLHEEASAPLASVALPADGEVLLVVGPEGGITPRELEALEAAGATAVRLGASVLRTSTAGAAAAAVVSARTARWA